MTSERDEWAAVEYVREVLDDVRKRLRVGAKGQGATLTADECTKVLGCLSDPSFPNSRPPEVRKILIALYCSRLEGSGMQPKAAVAETAAHFGCSKSVVNAARRAQNG